MAPLAQTGSPVTTPEELTSGELEFLQKLLPPYRVILHNDDHNSMDHVVVALTKSVPELSAERATEIMLRAHTQGKAVVTTKPKELAELYASRLQGFGLTATVERDS
jgi:ATP-dependent Clp protease adaptor protein ClpS